LKINITSRHEKLTEGLKNHVEDKIQRVERYLGKIKEAHVILNFEKNVHVCEATLAAKNLKLSAKATSRDMYQSIDAALSRLETQAQKQKDKRAGHYRAKGERSVVSDGGVSDPAENEEIKVIKTKKFALKPMTVEEAAMQLAATKDEFLVFYNAENERTSVVYKRADHQIGLIEPEY
jgi:putative sigma-54 modulation protein